MLAGFQLNAVKSIYGCHKKSPQPEVRLGRWWGRGSLPNLAAHVEAEADAVVVLREVADGAEGTVAADGGNGLEHGEELLRLEEDAHAAGGLLGIGGQREEQGLHRDEALLGVVGVGAADGLAVDLSAELSVLGERELGVRRVDAEGVVVGGKLLLGGGGCHFAAGLCQQVLGGEGHAGLAVAPGADEVGL